MENWIRFGNRYINMDTVEMVSVYKDSSYARYEVQFTSGAGPIYLSDETSFEAMKHWLDENVEDTRYAQRG